MNTNWRLDCLKDDVTGPVQRVLQRNLEPRRAENAITAVAILQGSINEDRNRITLYYSALVHQYENDSCTSELLSQFRRDYLQEALLPIGHQVLRQIDP